MGLTTTVLVAVPVHPAGVVTVTVYIVVVSGVTKILDPFKEPGCHIYVPAGPLAFRLVLCPQLRVIVAGAMLTVLGPTMMVWVAVFVQPNEFVAVTV